MEDRVLVCKDCGNEFVFTVGEQEFYAEKGFQNEPARCKDCRSAKKERMGQKSQRKLYDAVCSDCGNETKVPFMPKEDRPVYCSECLEKHRGE
jgi:CxxC-x17-CxxC domain-containing protein